MLSNEAIHQQVETLLSQMTLEEKAAQLCGDLPAFKRRLCHV